MPALPAAENAIPFTQFAHLMRLKDIECPGALAGIAAEGLQSQSGIESRTIHARLMLEIENGREKLSKNDVLIVDEAGLISTRQMAKIVAQVHKSGAKVVLVGAFQQLQPPGADFARKKNA